MRASGTPPLIVSGWQAGTPGRLIRAWRSDIILNVARTRKGYRGVGKSWIVSRAIPAVATFLLAVVPLLDLAWNEPQLDEGDGVYCQLHANPGVNLEPATPRVSSPAEMFPLTSPLARLPLRGSSIFIPPRA